MEYKSLKELTINNRGYYGISASACTYNVLYPQYLRITDISEDGDIPFILPTSIDPKQNKKWSDYLLRKNDIVFARTGSVGRNYFCKNNMNNVVHAGYLIKFSINPSLVVPKYVGYYCQSQHYRESIKALFSGSVMNNINAQQYGKLLIPINKSNIQQHIVDILRII